MTSQLVVDAPMMAVGAEASQLGCCITRTREAKYTSEHFHELLKDQGITCSTSHAGEVWDNSAMESFVQFTED